MTSIARRAAVAIAAAVLAPAVSGLGTAAPRTTTSPKATFDRTLRATVQMARGPAVQTIVTGWDRSSLKVLDTLKVKHRHLRALPMAFAKLTPAQIRTVVASKNIRSVYGEQQYRLMMNESAALIGARYAAERLKVDGTGSAIAVVDTGIDATHTDLDGDKVLHNYEVLAPGVNDPGQPLLTESPMTDDDEHGTHVAGTIAGTGELAASDPEYAGRDLRGVAPGAKLIGYSANIPKAGLLTSITVAAFDHIIATRAETGVRAISNSWGGSDGSDFEPNGPVAVAQEAAWRAGIVPVFAAGNSGNPGDTSADGLNTLSGQCISPFVVCVAAMTKHSQVVTFSSKGRPTANFDRAIAQRYRVGLYRPSVTAPGVNITAPAAISTADGDKPHGYLTISGTSMSTPMVSGVIALITSANPKLTPAQIVRVLESTADPIPGWSAHEDGAGAVNARRAVEAALAMKAGRDPRLAAPRLSYARPATTSKQIASFEGTALPASWLHHQGVTNHSFTVPAGTERVDLDLSWDLEGEPNEAQNMYAFLWEPGVKPNDESPSGAPFASQETWGLLCDGPAPANPCTLTGRKATVMYPKAGEWTLRIFGRTTAVAYKAVLTAKTFASPVTTASVSGGFLRGTAKLPAADRAGAVLQPLAGTQVGIKNPTEKPAQVFFHDVLPAGGFTADGATWNTTKPDAATPTTWHGAGSDLGTYAEFQATTPKALQGALPVSFWGGSTQGGLEWRVRLFVGPPPDSTLLGAQEEPAAETVGVGGLSEVPSLITATLPYVEVPAGKLVRIRLAPQFLNDAHFSVYYDSADMPSGMVLPVVDKIVARGTLAVTDATLSEVRGSGAAVLSWSRVEGATGYRVYRGETVDRLRPAGRVPQVPKPAVRTVSKPPIEITGDLSVGNPANGFAGGVTEIEFIFFCPTVPASQGFDGFVFDIPAESRDGRQTITVAGTSEIPYDLDVHLYDEDCQPIPDPGNDLTSDSANESGVIPAAARWGIVTEFLGGPMTFTARMTRGGVVGGVKNATLKWTAAGLRADAPAYFRVAAIDAAGKEGPATNLFVSIPSTFARAVEASADGGAWRSIPVGANGSWSVPLASILGGINAAAGSSHKIQVRARAGEAVGPAVTVTASGSFRPVDQGPLPSTGVGPGALGIALLGVAGAIALRARRRKIV